MSRHRLLTREALGDVLVNLLPLTVLGTFITMFFVIGPYPISPVETTIQVSLVAIPGLVLLVLTYYALKAVETSDGELGGGAGAGYVETDPEIDPEVDPETVPPADDD
jgi:hypothetical protein